MLHTKYQSSRPSTFREEELWNFHSLFLCSTYDPQGRASFDLRGILWTNLVEVHKEMPHTKYQISTPSSFRKEKFWRWASLFPCSNLWPPGRGQLWPQGHHMNKLSRGSQSSRPSSFREEKFWNFLSLFLYSNLWPLGQAQFWPQWHHMNKLGRGPQEDAIYQISKL